MEAKLTQFRTFLVADRILHPAAKAWLAESRFHASPIQHGVSIHEADDARIILVDPQGYSLAHLAQIVRVAMCTTSELNIVAPSIIQYFASKMDKGENIFNAINILSKYVVSVRSAPVFRVLNEQGGDDLSAGYRHQLTFSSFPKNRDDIECLYFGNEGVPLTVTDLNLPPPVAPTAAPLVFYHSGWANQRFEKEALIRLADRQNFKFERNAFDQMMLRFPSRDANPKELEALGKRLNLETSVVDAIWMHNRLQWDKVRRQLNELDYYVPEPTKNKVGSKDYNLFTHLVVSGTMKLVSRLDVPVPRVRHLGIPLFARNGVTIPINLGGILEAYDDFTSQTVDQRIVGMLPLVFGAQVGVDIHSSVANTVVAA